MCAELIVTKQSPGSVLSPPRLIACVTNRSSRLPLTLRLLSRPACVTAAIGTSSPRVRFKDSDPIVDSSLVILSTEVPDEGSYLCRITTFPLGNFDRELSVTVWSESLRNDVL